MLNYEGLPEHIRESIKQYIEVGCPVGHFLQSVISNKLKESFMYADDININRMFDIVNFFYNEVPLTCWGSEKAYKAWIKQGGLKKETP